MLAAPWWAPHSQLLGGHNLFVAADSLVLLGLSILMGFVGSLILPRTLVTLSEQIAAFAKYHSKIFLLLVLTAVLLFYGYLNRSVLLSFLNSADEHSCYFLAECLRKGKLWISPHPLSEFFNVVHVGNKAGKWFSVYPPGWPLIWSFFLGTSWANWLNPIMVTASLGLFYVIGKKLFGFSVAALGILLLAFSPFFAFTGASYFSHGTCLFTIALFLYSYLRWDAAQSEKHRIVWAAIAASAVGYGLMTRYLTMAALAAPFFLYQGWLLFKRRRVWRPSDTVAVAILLFFMGLVLVQNYLVTGKPFRAPNRFDKSWEKLGFRKNYTPLDGIIFFIARFFYLCDWFAPAIIVVYLLSLFQTRSFSPNQQLFRFGFVYVAVAYFFYFSWGGNQWGPRYYYEGMPFLTIVAADFLRSKWLEGGDRPKKFVLGVLLVSFISNGYLFLKQITFFSQAISQRKAIYVLAEKTIRKPAIVFLRGFFGKKLVMAEEDAVRNSPWLDAKILYAHDLGTKNVELKKYYPDREYYLGAYDPAVELAKLVKD